MFIDEAAEGISIIILTGQDVFTNCGDTAGDSGMQWFSIHFITNNSKHIARLNSLSLDIPTDRCKKDAEECWKHTRRNPWLSS